MRAVTYNLWEGGVGEAGDRRSRLRAVLRDLRPDVAALIEARGFDRELKEWERSLEMEGSLAHAPSGYHVALLVRPPLRIVSTGALHSPVFYHACLSARVKGPDGELQILATHLNPFDPETRLSEARHLAREAYNDRPVLLMGDFNAISPRDQIDESVLSLSKRVLSRHVLMPASPVEDHPAFDTRAVGLLEWAGFTDLFRQLNSEDPGWTLPTGAGKKQGTARLRLDYVFATRPLAERARSSTVIRTPDADVASDHFPLVAEFE